MKAMYPFSNESDMVVEAEKLFLDDHNDRADRAMISGFYNGGKPMSDEEIKQSGYNKNVNFLSGFPNMKGVYDQAKSYLTVNRNTNFELKLVDGNDAMHMRANKALQQAFNKMIGDYKKFFNEYEVLCANAVLHGTGIFMFMNDSDVFPVNVTPDNVLIPKGSNRDSSCISYFCITDKMNRHDLEDKINATGWDSKKIKALLAEKSDSNAEGNGGRASTITDINQQEESDAVAMDVTTGDLNRFECLVYRFFQASNDGKSVKITVITRGSDSPKYSKASDSESNAEIDKTVGSKSCYTLYSHEHTGSISDYILGMHIDCSMNDRDLWHKVLGFGTIQYPSDAEREFTINRIFESAQEGMKQLYRSTDEANREVTDSIEIRNNGLLPKNVEAFDRKNLGKDINQALQMLGVVDAMSEGKTGVSGHAKYNRDEETIQVQTERQRLNDISRKSSFASWKRYLDELGYSIFSKALSGKYDKSDPCAKHIKRFLSTVESIKTHLEINITADSVDIAYKSIIGDGSDAQSKQVYQYLAGNIDRLPAQSKSLALNVMAEIASGDQRFADLIAPIDDELDSVPQKRIAQYENSICITQGIVPEVSRGDVDLIHIPEHFKGMESLLGQYKDGFTISGYNAFLAIGGHVAAHAKNLESMNQVNASRQIMSTLNDISDAGEQLTANIKQQAESGGQQDIEQQLKVEQHRLDQRKQLFKESQAENKKYEFERKQTQREQKDDKMLTLAERRQILMEQQANFSAMSKVRQNQINAELSAIDLEIKASKEAGNVRS